VVLEGCEVTVNVAAAGTIGLGPLDHTVSFGPVSRLCAAQKPIISENFNKNLKVLSAGEVRSQLRARKGKVAQISLPKFRNRNFLIFSKSLLCDCGTSRALLGMRKRVLNAPAVRLAHPSSPPWDCAISAGTKQRGQGRADQNSLREFKIPNYRFRKTCCY